MATSTFLRRLSLSPTTTAILRRQQHRTTATSIKEGTNKPTEKTDEKSRGKWVILPPFTPAVNPDSLGKRISNRSNKKEEGVETTSSALKWVVRCCPHLPLSLINKLFRLRQVRRECLGEAKDVDHGAEAQEFRLKRVGAKDFMNEGERIFLPVSVHVQGLPVKKQKFVHIEEEMDFVRGLELYKDSAIIAINKPPKLPVQGGLGIKKSLDELAAAYLRYDCRDPPRLVHRLDRDCSGVLVMGRTRTSTAVLHTIFREKTAGLLDDEVECNKRTLHKRYLALVLGVPQQSNGRISAPLAKVILDDGKSERIVVTDITSSSQHSVTEFRVIETSKHGFTWLELSPLTGRKHQLRVHCAEVLGTPIIGDYKYGWQAHRKWEPLSHVMQPSDRKLWEAQSNRFGLDMICGSIAEEQPHLHLHCKQLTLPNISSALNYATHDSEYDFTKLESLNLVAPLPLHMQRSWSLLNSLSQ